MNTNGKTLTIPVHSEAGKKLQDQLNEDRTLTAISHLLERIDTLDKAVDNLTELMQQGPGMVAMATDMLDETYQKVDSTGVSLDVRLQNALHIADKLTSPEMVEKIDQLIALTDEIPGFITMNVDLVDDALMKVNESGIDLEERLGNALQLAERLTDPKMVEQLNYLMDLGDQLPGMVAMAGDIFDEQMREAREKGFDPKYLMEIARTANHALTAARKEEPAKVGGVFGLFRVLKDPDRQRGIGFLMNFLKHFGKEI